MNTQQFFEIFELLYTLLSIAHCILHTAWRSYLIEKEPTFWCDSYSYFILYSGMSEKEEHLQYNFVGLKCKNLSAIKNIFPKLNQP